MKKIYFLLLILFGLNLQGQIVNIPDPVFKARLLNPNPGNISSTQTPSVTGIVNSYHSIDINGDGEIQVSEALSIKWLNVENSTIVDLTGIEAFANLIYLKFSYNRINSINLSSNNVLSICSYTECR